MTAAPPLVQRHAVRHSVTFTVVSGAGALRRRGAAGVTEI